MSCDQIKNEAATDFPSHNYIFYGGRELNESQQKAYNFLEENHVEEIFNFMIEHLLVNSPREPLTFLETLLDRCITFRDTIFAPPLLFDKPHQELIFRAFDPGERGFVTYDQYLIGMKTVGLKIFNSEPKMNKNQIVLKKTFLKEMDRALITQLYSMLGGKNEELDLYKMARGSEDLGPRQHSLGTLGSLGSISLDGSSKSSITFFLPTTSEGSEDYADPRITHSVFLEHISRTLSKMTDDIGKELSSEGTGIRSGSEHSAEILSEEKTKDSKHEGIGVFDAKKSNDDVAKRFSSKSLTFVEEQVADYKMGSDSSSKKSILKDAKNSGSVDLKEGVDIGSYSKFEEAGNSVDKKSKEHVIAGSSSDL